MGPIVHANTAESMAARCHGAGWVAPYYRREKQRQSPVLTPFDPKELGEPLPPVRFDSEGKIRKTL